MKTQISSMKIIMASIMSLALILALVFFLGKNKANRNLDQEKLRSEKFLSEKISLEETLGKMKAQLNSLSGKNAQLDKIVSERNEQLINKEAEIKKLLAENASIASLRMKLTELENLQQELNDELDALNLSNNDLSTENERLNEMLKASKVDYEILSTNYAIFKAMVGDNYRVEALKGKNDKLTVNARRTDRLSVSFDMPESAAQGLHFTIVDPEGDEFSSKSDKAVSLNTVSNYDHLFASTENVSGSQNSSRSELVYTPDHKLAKGIYIIKIYNGNDYIGSTQVKLK